MYKLPLLLVLLIAYRCQCEFDYSQYYPGGGGGSTAAPIVFECGVGLTPINGDNNGTRNAEPGEVAWEVSVQGKTNGKWAHACGGVVVNKNFVLTTAKCIGGNKEAFLRSEAGNVNLTKGGWVRRRRASYPGQQTPGLQYTMRTFIHPDYDKDTLANNLALISLAQPFDVQKAAGAINTICLPSSLKEDHSSEQHFVSGWGAIEGVVELRPKLQIVKASVVECEASAPALANQLCVVEDLDDTVGDCVGDFGGPLFATKGNTSTLVGLYSSGTGCGANNTAKFIDIKPYITWINDNSKPVNGQ